MPAVQILAQTTWPRLRSGFRRVAGLGPGLVAALLVAGVALAFHELQAALFGRVWIDRMGVAIVLGAALRMAWTPSERWQAGLRFGAKQVLEVAIVLLGASVSVQALVALGLWTPFWIFAVVLLALGLGFMIGRTLGLSRRLALLVAFGNAICGNSAIVAAAPLVEAEADEVACAVAYSAMLGVAAVLGLPILGTWLHMRGPQYGLLTGLTVFAVPHVLAAAAPMGSTAVRVGALVKLTRVLMLGPVCLVLAAIGRRAGLRGGPPNLPLARALPWFIIGFAALSGARSMGLVPTTAVPRVSTAAADLTLVSMAALGLCSDLKAIVRAGPRVAAAAILSLSVLGATSLALAMTLGRS